MWCVCVSVRPSDKSYLLPSSYFMCNRDMSTVASPPQTTNSELTGNDAIPVVKCVYIARYI